MDISDRTFTVEEFWNFTDQNPDGRYELINGKIVELPSLPIFHAVTVSKITYFLVSYDIENKNFYAFASGVHYALAPAHVLRPKGSMVARKRIKSLDERADFAPDVAVEIVYSKLSYRELSYKIRIYMRYGTRLLWVVYPDLKSVDVYTSVSDNRINLQYSGEDDIIDGGTVLPGFSVKVRDLFPDIEQE